MNSEKRTIVGEPEEKKVFNRDELKQTLMIVQGPIIFRAHN